MIRSFAAITLVAIGFAVQTLAASAAGHVPARRPLPGATYRSLPRTNAGSTFSPTSVPNLALWLDAADSTTLTQSNGKVSQWIDKSGAGNNVLQSTVSAQPSLVAGALNGYANVAFDGVASYLKTTYSFTQSLYPASTTFLVAKAVSSSTSHGTLWNGGNIGGYPRWGYGVPSSGQAKLYFGGQNDQLTYPSGLNLTAPAIYDGGESVSAQQGFINFNGTPEGSISSGITGDTGSNPLSVGARYQPSPAQTGDYYKGNIAEVLVYHALLSTSQTQQLEGYLACKWGLQASLPANHPYRSTCPGGNPPPPPTTVDVDTYHNDNLRTGWNANETTLTPSNVASSFGQTMNLPVDGLTFMQPLIAANESTGSGTHDLVISGTNNDTLYAFDANTGALVWKRSFLASGVTTVGIAFTGCDNTGQQDGLLSTPVIDRSTDTLYVVAATMEPHHIHFRLHALSLATGADKMANVEILGSSGGQAFNADVQFQRPALLEANGNIYAGFGSQCDYHQSAYHGWVFGYNASNFAQTGAAEFTPTADSNGHYAGGVWMSGEGLSADASGNVYFSTGNGTFDNGVRNFGESVLRLPPNLSLGSMSSASFFTPYTVFSDNSGDRDLASGGVMLLPDQPFAQPHLAVAQGKDGILTLLNRDNLGGYRAGGPDNALAELSLGGVWSAPAYWRDANGNANVLTTGGPLYSIRVGSASLTKAGNTSVTFPSDNGNGSTPSISSNGTSSAIVWIVQRVKNASTDTNYLYAFDATNLASQLFKGSLGGWPQNDLNPTFVPTIANGKVYVPTQNSIAVFGLH